MQEYFLESRGIYYRTNNWEEGQKTLIFIHGLVGSSSAWKPFEERLLSSYNLLTYDLRGHGKSVKPRHHASYAMHHHVEDLYTLIRTLGAKHFTLVSHSFGTLIALEFIALHEHMLAGAVFLSPSFSLSKVRKTRIARPLYNGLGKLMRLLPFFSKVRGNGHVDYTKYEGSGDWNVRRTIADMHNTSLHVYFYSMVHVYSVEREALLRTISIPTLMIHGKKDGMFPVENSHIMSKEIPDSRLLILEHADHIIVLNNADEVTQAIEQFLAVANSSPIPAP